MYGIFPYIWLEFMVNVGKYTIHGSYGFPKDSVDIKPFSNIKNTSWDSMIASWDSMIASWDSMIASWDSMTVFFSMGNLDTIHVWYIYHHLPIGALVFWPLNLFLLTPPCFRGVKSKVPFTYIHVLWLFVLINMDACYWTLEEVPSWYI